MEHVLKEYECVICHDLIASSTCLTSCGDMFCYKCIYDWNTYSKKCPICRCNFQLFRCVPNKVVDNAIRATLQSDSSFQQRLQEWEERLENGNKARKRGTISDKSQPGPTRAVRREVTDAPPNNPTRINHNTNTPRLSRVRPLLRVPVADQSNISVRSSNNNGGSTNTLSTPPVVRTTNIAPLDSSARPLPNRYQIQPPIIPRATLNLLDEPLPRRAFDGNPLFAINGAQSVSQSPPSQSLPLGNSNYSISIEGVNDRSYSFRNQANSNPIFQEVSFPPQTSSTLFTDPFITSSPTIFHIGTNSSQARRRAYK